jgi:leukotriene-A4 hydrolase
MKNFLRLYITKFRLTSIEVWDMKEFLEDYIRKNLDDVEDVIKRIDWNYWLFGKGMTSAVYTRFARNEMTDKVQRLADCYESTAEICQKEIYSNLALDLKIIFVKTLLKDNQFLDSTKVERIRKELNITNDNKNPEILSIWFSILVKSIPSADKENIKSFLESYGRLKFIRPVYMSYAEANRTLGLEIYTALRPRYHPIAQRAIDKILGFN